MKESPFSLDVNEEQGQAPQLKEVAARYLRFWPWFAAAAVLGIALGYAYMRYAPVVYQSTAKIKIVDDSQEANITEEAMAAFTGSPKVNLDNEIEVIKSYRLLQQVVSALHLDVRYFAVGNVKKSEIWDPPFVVVKQVAEDSLREPLEYEVEMGSKAFHITDAKGREYNLSYNHTDLAPAGLPFEISLKKDISPEALDFTSFMFRLGSHKEAVLALVENVEVYPTNKDSDILTLSLKGESVTRSEAILNTLIEKFDQDGITDRQLVSRRTLEVIDDRFIYLTRELDSIESGKQNFKQSNNLSYIEADAGLTLQKKSETEEDVMALENQISLSKLLKETVISQADYSLIPADIGLSNMSLNALVSDYNEMALERQKLLPNVGASHPTLQNLSAQLQRGKANIIKSVNIYQTQLESSLNRLTRERNIAGSMFSRLPEKEKMLRSIERQQSIKEKLFLILLEKREEAAINVAATAPSVKVVDYSLTGSKPIAPRKTLVYPLSLALGMLLPFIFLFVRFSLDTKIQQRADVEEGNPEVPILAELPFFKEHKRFVGPADRSVLAESFRILGTNINYRQPRQPGELARRIYVTSSIKGEGKSLVALNLALSYASLKKKVLLVGADLRNPQLHEHLELDHKGMGLSEYLENSKLGLGDCLQQAGGLDICYSTTKPDNAPELLSGDRFAEFISEASDVYDYIIVDTAPTLPVTDTLLISGHADMTLFILRAGFTDKRLLDFTRELQQTGRLREMAFVLNEVGKGSSGYNYGHAYGYGSAK